MTNKPNVTVFQKSMENAERFNSPSSLAAEEIKRRIRGAGGNMTQLGRQRNNRLRVTDNRLLGPSFSYHTHKLWIFLQVERLINLEIQSKAHIKTNWDQGSQVFFSLKTDKCL